MSQPGASSNSARLVLADGAVYEGYSFGADTTVCGEVCGEVVFNTITGSTRDLRGGFYIRRAATERRIPCFTSLDTARAAADALINGSQAFNVQPLPDYREKSSK